jgi:hypothetical protein
VCELHYALPRDGAAREQLVGLGYLKSYEGMGRVRVECARGCSSPACRECHTSRACHTNILLVPHLAGLASCGLLSRRLASLRTRHEPVSRSKPNRKLRCWCQLLPTSLILRRLNPQAAGQSHSTATTKQRSRPMTCTI